MIDNVRFFIEPWRELKGISLETIQDLVEKKKLNDVFRKAGEQGFNIAKITKENFDAVLKLDGSFTNIIVNEARFLQAHKMFENEMITKSNGIPFTDFNHPHLLEDEINYKREIAEKMHLPEAQVSPVSATWLPSRQHTLWIVWDQIKGEITPDEMEDHKRLALEGKLVSKGHGQVVPEASGFHCIRHFGR